MNAYVASVIENVKQKHGNEPEFVQTVEEVFSSISPVIDAHPEYVKADLLNRMVEPERMFTFRVVWMDDKGDYHTNIGYRCQFNGAIGPYKGGLRFQKNVYPGIIKFLGFEQIFKNSLTGLPIGGGKGGSDFDPAGKSDAEVMRFCQSFMTALYRYIGPDVDVPAGDMGVGGREIGYLFGQYRRLKGVWENGVLTGKGFSFGGSLTRPEATGYGAMYYLQEVLKHEGEDIKGKTIACAGFGNVTWGICKKAMHLGAKVVTISGPDGYVYDPAGVSSSQEKIDYLVTMRNSGRNVVKDYADKFPGCEFHPGEKPWGVKVDVIMPSAMQNDVKMDSAQKIVANHIKYYIEVANMPTTNDALAFLMSQKDMIVAPSKAVNAGGVGVSALEMAQNSERLVWTAEEVDAQLHKMMQNIHKVSAEAAEEYGLGYNLVAGANIAGFKKVAEAMMQQGIF
jgi:glutamate dehydrogenase (NADP+)